MVSRYSARLLRHPLALIESTLMHSRLGIANCLANLLIYAKKDTTINDYNLGFTTYQTMSCLSLLNAPGKVS